MQFVYDEVSEIIAIETMACSNEYKIATPLDVVYRDKKGVLCNVNIKTSSQIGNHHRNQVSFEKYMWNLTYPEMQIEKTGIIRPKDWKIDKVPTYELEFVKDDAERVASLCEKFGCVLRDPDASYDAFRRETRVFTGEIELGGKPQIAIKTLQEAFEESMETI